MRWVAATPADVGVVFTHVYTLALFAVLRDSAGKECGFHGFLSVLSCVLFLTLVLSSDNVSHKFHKLVYGTGKTGWALHTCRVWEVKDMGKQHVNCPLGISMELLVSIAEGAKLVKAGKSFGEGFLSVGEKSLIERAVPSVQERENRTGL